MFKKLTEVALAALSAAVFAEIIGDVPVSETGPAASLGTLEKNTIARLLRA
ncbi:MAG: hypothetical protein JNK92_02255 [Dechloromonas sp.]|nr:hypothetical protein [Dechloromonas sp.]